MTQPRPQPALPSWSTHMPTHMRVSLAFVEHRVNAWLRFGKAVREILLCQKVPLPPANVNFTLVQDTKNPQYKTARARLRAHATEATCAGCHKIMDPVGLGLEGFDSGGSLRNSENGVALDPTEWLQRRK